MKKTEKLLSTLLMVVMLISSVGLLYASIYASGSGTHSTFSSVVFDKETGIRFNKLTGEFEVFNEAGVSWIGSNRYISVDGKVELSSVINNPDISTHEKADDSKTYNIMRDIAYSTPTQTVVNGEDIYNTAFDTNKITLGATGVIDGRGFTLKNFKVKTMTLEIKSIGSAIVAINNGTIRNLNVSNADFSSATSGDAAAIICGINKGVIDSCMVYGMMSNSAYQSDRYTGLYGIAAITSGKIINSLNNSHLDNTKASSLSAGLAGVDAGATLLNNINNGNITSTAHAAGIAIDSSGVVFVVRGNKNNGTITAPTSVSGIIDGGSDLTNLDGRGNVNNGELESETNYELYYGVEEGGAVVEIPIYGIKYNSELNDSGGGFEIFNADGISWISSGAVFDEDGNKDLAAGVATADTSYYEVSSLIKAIDFNKRGANFDDGGTYNKAFNGGSDGTAPSIAKEGVFNGNNCTLKNFPLRQCGVDSTSAKYYSTLFYENVGTIKNMTVVVNDSLSGFSGEYVGGVVGRSSMWPNRGTALISNINVTGSITVSGWTGDTCLGGLVGSGFSLTILNVNVKMNLSGAKYTGGIGGYFEEVDISGSSFVGNIGTEGTSPNYGGGIAGWAWENNHITECHVAGNNFEGWSGWAYGYFLIDYSISPTLNNNTSGMYLNNEWSGGSFYGSNNPDYPFGFYFLAPP